MTSPLVPLTPSACAGHYKDHTGPLRYRASVAAVVRHHDPHLHSLPQVHSVFGARACHVSRAGCYQTKKTKEQKRNIKWGEKMRK